MNIFQLYTNVCRIKDKSTIIIQMGESVGETTRNLQLTFCRSDIQCKWSVKNMKIIASSFDQIFRSALALSAAFIMLMVARVPASAQTASFAKLDFVANIETVGVIVGGANLPAAAELLYRQSGETTWRQGHPLTQMNDGRLIGSVFGLLPSTTYEVKARDGIAEIAGMVTTQADEIQFAPAAILYVDGKAALNGNGSSSAPFKKIQDAVNRAAAGTQILVADGIYREAIVFPNSGAENNWIQLKAQGSGAILDGARTLSGNVWTPVAKNVWFTKIAAPIAYLARDQKRYYMYDNLTGLMNGVGHNKVAMREGFYIAPSTTRLYVRSLDNPANHLWRIPLFNEAIKTDGRDWLWIEGFEIRFYGSQYGCGICMKNASHVIIRKNKIHNLQKGIFIEWTGGDASGNDTRIEYNEIYDPPVNEWAWKAVKATSMEGTGIIIRGRTGAIVRGNNVHNFFNGIYTGSSGDAENSALAFDADIYDNHIHHISDDALEPEGACINQRFRNNAIDTIFVGVSLAPITQGPVWVLRSTFANYTGRGIKLDRNSDGAVFIYHNTFWTNQLNPNAADLISAVHHVTMLNNIFQNNHYAVYAVPLGLTGNHWNSNDWYSVYSPRFKWENINYASVRTLCAATGLECNGYGDAPQLTNPSGGDFNLLSSSPNIDRGVLISGINDNFSGAAPDIGAYEFASNLPPIVTTPTPTMTPVPIATTPTPIVTVTQTSVATTSVTFNSNGGQDGWILESGEFSAKGGTLDKASTVLQIGDDNQDRQYKSILSFVTDTLPDNAAIIAAQLNIKRQGVVGINPFSAHGNLLAEMISGTFSGNVELIVDDFSAPASLGSVQEIFSAADLWYTVKLSGTNLAFINKMGATQFRLLFSKDDNDNLSADYLKIFSGNAAVADQPQLIVIYYLPSP